MDAIALLISSSSTQLPVDVVCEWLTKSKVASIISVVPLEEAIVRPTQDQLVLKRAVATNVDQQRPAARVAMAHTENPLDTSDFDKC